MIKRVDISPVADPGRTQPRPKTQGPGEEFASVLEKALQPEPASTTPASATPSTTTTQAIRLQGVQAVEGLLKMLESYAQLLGSPATLRQLESVVGELSVKIQRVRSALEAGLEPALEQTAREALALAEAEVLKFRRGEYLPTGD